jgi:hypothetical protein
MGQNAKLVVVRHLFLLFVELHFFNRNIYLQNEFSVTAFIIPGRMDILVMTTPCKKKTKKKRMDWRVTLGLRFACYFLLSLSEVEQFICKTQSIIKVHDVLSLHLF